MPGGEFKKLGYRLVDDIAEFIETIGSRKVTPGETPEEVAAALGSRPLPEDGIPAGELLERAGELMFGHSLFNAHPSFMGYITGAPAPIGALGDLLASSVNPNAGAQILSPVATEIEKQTVAWLAELIGLPEGYGGLLVSGGNMANMTAFLAARMARAPESYRKKGICSGGHMTLYCSKATHTWLEKSAALFGHGTDAIRWIPTGQGSRIDMDAFESTVAEDKRKGHTPLFAVGNAGDVSTGAVDDLEAMATICVKHNIWFHVDGAYGMPAAALPEMADMFRGTELADSVALDPHKWLYNPLEAGCTLVKDPGHLRAAFSTHPDYYNFDAQEGSRPVNFFEYGLQNSRGFRALKVWLALQQAGRNGYREMIREDIRLAALLYQKADDHPELEAMTHNLSIATFRYVPEGMDTGSLNRLNESIVNALQRDGRVFVSNALVDGKYCLRACIVNFRTGEDDIDRVIGQAVEKGRVLSR